MKYLAILILALFVFSACAGKTIQGEATTGLRTLDDTSKLGNEKTVPVNNVPEDTNSGTQSYLSADINVGQGLSNYFGNGGIITPKHVSWLSAGFIENNGLSSRYEEQIILSNDNNFGVHTALSMHAENMMSIYSSGSEELSSRVTIPIQNGNLKYKYLLSNSLIISNASMNSPVMINFLGENLEIWGSSNSEQIIVVAGERFTLEANDTLSYQDNTITLVRTTDDAAIITVNGLSELINVHDLEEVSGVSIYVEAVYNGEGVETDSADLIISVGYNPVETYSDGDAYIGEPENTNVWEWDIDLAQGYIGVNWVLNVVEPSGVDDNSMNIEHPLYEGEEYRLPNDFASIKFNGLNYPFTNEAGSGYNLVRLGITRDINVTYNETYTERIPSLVRVRSFWNPGFNGLIVDNQTTSEVYLYRRNNEFEMAYNNFADNVVYNVPLQPNQVVLFRIETDNLVYDFLNLGDSFGYEFPNGEMLELQLPVTNGTYETMVGASLLSNTNSTTVNVTNREADYRNYFGAVIEDPSYAFSTWFTGLVVNYPPSQVTAEVVISADYVPIEEDLPEIDNPVVR